MGLQHFLVLASILFCIGMYGALARSNAVGILLSIELMLNAVNIMMVAFSTYTNAEQFAGQLFAIFIMTVAAAEAAVGLAIVIAVYRLRHTIQVDEIDLLKG
ncbi:MAG: NADH-quinone oxidoreductase subunit NuoK [Chloroflexi bacterium]|nr:NADH-quinone oxidoreductase subunit NuoK [Chloroflexota bacterium]